VTIASCIVLAFPSTAEAATYRVRADGNDWRPKIKRIVRGDRVVWRNPTGRRHDVVSRGKNWSYRAVLDPGERTDPKRFGKIGRYRYRCTLHSGIVDGVCKGMCGVIRVRRP
jgi:plastocyanin